MFEPTTIAGLWLIRQPRVSDERGGFARLFSAEDLAARGVGPFTQASLSITRVAGTLRGLHFQRPPHAETKLVRCLRGAIFDVVVDLRPESATYRRWESFILTQDDDHSLCIPPGCAHGFQTLRDGCEVLYHMDTPYAPDFADGVRFDDTALGIDWPLPVGVISARDQAWPSLDG